MRVPDDWRPVWYQTSIDDQVFAFSAEQFVGDNPSYREAMHGPDASGWRRAMDDEISNLNTHDAYDERPEDSFTSWSTKRQRAEELLNTLWVLRSKRGANNEEIEKKGRCTFDGRGQKEVALLQGRKLNTFSPCVRSSTHKAHLIKATAKARRVRTLNNGSG